MSMGSAKEEKVMVNGKERTSRIPQKPLNKYTKARLLVYLLRDDISIEPENSTMGSNEWVVRDLDGNYLFSYDNAWDYGYYRIFMATKPEKNAKRLLVAEMDWFENDNYTNPQQQDIVDIANRLDEKRKELYLKKKKQEELEEQNKKDKAALEAARESLSAEELQALQALGMSM